MSEAPPSLSARLRALAFHRCPGPEANAALATLREEYEASFGRAIPYELLLPDGDGAPDAALLPRLWVHLQAKRSALPCRELFGALFHEGTLYFVRGPALLEALAEAAGVPPEEAALDAHLEAWRRRAEGAVALALPPPG